jgi:hypothetical protein
MHNEEKFPNPMEFKPERFLNPDGSLNENIRDPATAVFGFGRRRELLLVCATLRSNVITVLAVLSDSAPVVTLPSLPCGQPLHRLWRLSGSRESSVTTEKQLNQDLTVITFLESAG